jgi:hypothetical protein
MGTLNPLKRLSPSGYTSMQVRRKVGTVNFNEHAKFDDPFDFILDGSDLTPVQHALHVRVQLYTYVQRIRHTVHILLNVLPYVYVYTVHCTAVHVYFRKYESTSGSTRTSVPSKVILST